MKKNITLFIIGIASFLFIASETFAANGADCLARGGRCSTSCVSGGFLGYYDCPSANPMCCGDPAAAQQKIFESGGLNPFSSSGLNTKTSSFNNPLGENMGTVDKVLSSLSGYLNAVAGTIGGIFILIGAVMYMISTGNKEMAERGKKIVFASVAGVAIVVG